ncbi:hypothetical protein SCB49_08067 [unidentified eubacterium SCB49]|nr:hypothetical protein SCB49_08067 [unidentified eubacterium SCB49]
MKYILFFLIFTNGLYSQVGINTTDPNSTLDINGNLSIRSIANEADLSSAKNSILVTTTEEVKKVPLVAIFNEEFKSAVKGSFDNSSEIDINILGGNKIIPFDTEEFDLNNEFDTSSYTFTAKEDGIYVVKVQITQKNINVDTNFGVRLNKNGTVIHRNSFANIGIDVILLGTINVTPPGRSIDTIVALETGDTLSFEVESGLVGISTLAGSKASSYFSIHRIR